MNGLYGFPTWEKEVHDLLLANYAELRLDLRRVLQDARRDGHAANAEMDMEEFRDFVLDVRSRPRARRTTRRTRFEKMGAAFAKANESGKGLAGPARRRRAPVLRVPRRAAARLLLHDEPVLWRDARGRRLDA